jgi:hypothetical protein
MTPSVAGGTHAKHELFNNAATAKAFYTMFILLFAGSVGGADSVKLVFG